MPTKTEQLSLLLSYFQEIEENKPITISNIHKSTGLHFNTIRDNLQMFQSIQEFPFQIKVIQTERQYFVIKIPAVDGLTALSRKIDRILELLKKLLSNKK